MAETNPITLNEFYTTLKDGVMTRHQFQLVFNSKGVSGRDFSVYAESTTLPGSKITAEAVFFYGIPFQVPSNLNYDQEWSVVIRCDKKANIRGKLEDWMNQIVSLYDSSAGNYKGVIPSDTVDVMLLDPSLKNSTRTYVLEGLFPTTLGELSLDHKDSGVQTFTTTFAFQYWWVKNAEGTAGQIGVDPLA